MPRSRRVGALLLSGLASCGGCRRPEASVPEPRRTLETYFTSVVQNDDRWWSLLCEADQRATPRRQLAAPPSQRFVIKNVTQEGDYARAVVAVTGPDAVAVIEAMAKQPRTNPVTAPSEEEMARILNDPSLRHTTLDQEYRLLKRGEHWCVDTGTALIHELVAMSERARDLEASGHVDDANALREEVERRQAARFGPPNVKTTAAVKDLAARALDLDGLTRGGGSDLKDRLEDFKRRAPSAPAAPPPINLAPSLRAVGPDTYSISSDDVDALWEHLPALSTQARILPVRIGETMALRVSSVEPNSVWSRLGFVSGDVVETVDGFSTSTPEAALEAYQHMKETETVRVQVRRDGVLRTMTYHRLKASTATEPPQP